MQVLTHQVGDDSYPSHNEQEVTELGAGVDAVAVKVKDSVQDDGRQHNCSNTQGRPRAQGTHWRVGERCLVQCKAADSAGHRVASQHACAHPEWCACLELPQHVAAYRTQALAAIPAASSSLMSCLNPVLQRKCAQAVADSLTNVAEPCW
jgi:hypothetical protein